MWEHREGDAQICPQTLATELVSMAVEQQCSEARETRACQSLLPPL